MSLVLSRMLMLKKAFDSEGARGWVARANVKVFRIRDKKYGGLSEVMVL